MSDELFFPFAPLPPFPEGLPPEEAVKILWSFVAKLVDFTKSVTEVEIARTDMTNAQLVGQSAQNELNQNVLESLQSLWKAIDHLLPPETPRPKFLSSQSAESGPTAS